MKSDSMIKVTASVLSLSLFASTCFTTVSEAAGNKNGIISEKPVTVSALMMQSMSSKTVDNVISDKVTDVASSTQAELNKEKTEQKTKTEVRSTTTVNAVTNGNANEKVEGNTGVVAKTTGTANVAKTETTKKVSKYANKAIATVDVGNIRSKANTTSKVVGKIEKGAMCKVLKSKNGWAQVQSGKVKGYIRADLIAKGTEAEKIAPKYAKKYAVINTVTLKVREKNNTDSRVLTLVGEDEKYKILIEGKKWCKVKVDGEAGYVLKDYVKVTEKFATAKSMKEIIAEEEEEKAEQVSDNSSSGSKKSTKKTSSSKSSTSKSSTRKSSSRRSSSKKTYSKAGSKTGSSVASFALQFKGNPYRYGGTSLTNGTDCSGFTQSVYRSFGYSIPRDSRSQYSGAGRIVSMSELQAGDLLFYSNSSGRINHVALYIGGGQVVHASNPKDGIKVSNYRYRTPVRARRVIN